VPQNEQKLTEREYYLLGILAEPPTRNRDLHKYTAEAERLVQRGYLERGVTGAPSKQLFLYRITPKGRAAWQAYRFTGP
jgi:DNA-binding MarR family transcriptional regulator